MTKINAKALQEALTELVEIDEWVAEQCAALVKKTAEANLRREELRVLVRESYFPKPAEGKTTVETDGFQLVCEQKISRNIDEALLTNLKKHFTLLSIPTDKLVRRNPDLNLREYRKLTPQMRKQFDRCLTVKPATPFIKIIPYAT